MKRERVALQCTPIEGNKKPQDLYGGLFRPKNNSAAARNEALYKAKEQLAKILEEHKITYVRATD